MLAMIAGLAVAVVLRCNAADFAHILSQRTVSAETYAGLWWVSAATPTAATASIGWGCEEALAFL